MIPCRPARPRVAAAVFKLSAIVVALGASIIPARAGAFFDVTLGLGLKDDARIFLNVTNDYFAPAPAVGMELVTRCPAPVEDYPVILMLARASRRSPDEILRLRLDYLSWSDIMFRLNVSPGILFAGMERDPGPPYGKAWGYWRKHPRGERYEIRDRDVVELAKLQVAAGYHHVSPYSIITERNKGVTVEQFVAEKNRGRYPSHGRGHDKPKGPKDKEHGHPHDHD